MSKRDKRLMSAVEAAGYVLAAPDYDTAPLNPANVPQHHLEAEFRNGHRLAARKASEVASLAVAKLSPTADQPSRGHASRALTTTDPSHPATSWLNSALANLRPKGIAA